MGSAATVLEKLGHLLRGGARKEKMPKQERVRFTPYVPTPSPPTELGPFGRYDHPGEGIPRLTLWRREGFRLEAAKAAFREHHLPRRPLVRLIFDGEFTEEEREALLDDLHSVFYWVIEMKMTEEEFQRWRKAYPSAFVHPDETEHFLCVRSSSASSRVEKLPPPPKEA